MSSSSRYLPFAYGPVSGYRQSRRPYTVPFDFARQGRGFATVLSVEQIRHAGVKTGSLAPGSVNGISGAGYRIDARRCVAAPATRGLSQRQANDTTYHSPVDVCGKGQRPMIEPEVILANGPEEWVERAAMTAALLCLVHCLALPLLFAALPAVGLFLSLPENLHVWLLAFALPTSLFALVVGIIKHANPFPLLIGVVGLVLIALGAFTLARSSAETAITVIGSLCLAAAHLGNWRLRHSSHAHL